MPIGELLGNFFIKKSEKTNEHIKRHFLQSPSGDKSPKKIIVIYEPEGKGIGEAFYDPKTLTNSVPLEFYNFF